MRKEIDILVRAAGKRCAVVDKASHEFWTPAMLSEAQHAGLFQDETDLFPPDRQTEVAGPLPGGDPLGPGQLRYRAVGQTRHFLIFAAADGEPSSRARPTV
jgi:hypothetical protein